MANIEIERIVHIFSTPSEIPFNPFDGVVTRYPKPMLTVADNQRIEKLIPCAKLALSLNQYSVRTHILTLIGRIVCSEDYSVSECEDIADYLSPSGENLPLHAALMEIANND